MNIYSYIMDAVIIIGTNLVMVTIMDLVKQAIGRFLNYGVQIHRNYETFKEASAKLLNSRELTEEEVDNQYIYLKAQLYNINFDSFDNDINKIKQEVERIEAVEKIEDSNRDSYPMFAKI